jgi:tetratricopeptide (TPR) repeat protein
MNLNFQSLPLWLAEGLAEFYAFANISDEASGLGRTYRESLEMLKASSMIPLRTLMAVTRDSPYYRRQDKSRVFYAQSWILTHYLILGDRQAHAGQLIEFLRLIRSDVSEREAAERSFGDLKVLQSNLEKYIRSEKFFYVPVKTRLSVEEDQYVARKLSQAESLALRGDLLIRTNRLDEAKAMLEQALQLNPRCAAANEGMGLLFLKLRNEEQSRKYFSIAAELDSKSFLAQYYAAGLAYSKDKDYRATEKYLRKALEINPKFVPAYHVLSQTLMLEGVRLPEALELAMKAADLEPGESSHWINAGQILMVMGRYDEARRIGERRLSIAHTEAQRKQAEWLLSMIHNRQDRMPETQQRAEPPREDAQSMEAQQGAARELKTPLGNQAPAPLAPEIETGPAQKVEGVIRTVKCDSPAIMDVVLDSNGKQHRLHSEDYRQVQFRMGGPSEKREFRPCEELEGMRVQIEFLCIPGQGYSGLIKTVIIEK